MGKKWTYSEETRQARLAGLAKAREARALKHQATQPPPQTQATQPILIEKPKIDTNPWPETEQEKVTRWLQSTEKQTPAWKHQNRDKIKLAKKIISREEPNPWGKPSVKDRLVGWFNLVST